MIRRLKNILRHTLLQFQIPLTKNLEYDILTEKILKRTLKNHSNCIDIGAHKGEILELFLKYAPSGHHFGFEPIPDLFKNLRDNYKDKAQIFSYALSTVHGITEFNLVLDDPAYSGIKQRKYKSVDTQVSKIEVEVRTLDEIILPTNTRIDLIKIDVEGGEFDVLKGSVELLKKYKPILIFESGMGASDYYGTKPEHLYEFLTDIGYKVFTLKNFIKEITELTESDYRNLFESGSEYYFVAI